MRNRVVWNEEERSKFFEAARFFGAPRRGDSVKVFREALIRSGVRPRPYEPSLAKQMNDDRRNGPHYKPAVSAGEPLPTRELQAPAQAVQEQAPTAKIALFPPPPPQEVAAPPVRSSPIAEFLADIVLDVLNNPQIRQSLRGIVAEVMAPETELDQRQAITWRAPKFGREKLPRIVVVGADQQRVNIPEADIRIWTKDETHHRLRAILGGADAVVLMTRFIPHRAQEIVKGNAADKPLIYCNGAASDLETQIRTYLASRNQ